MLLNAVGGGAISFPEEKNLLRRCRGSTLLALLGGGWGSNSEEKALRNT